MIVAFLLPPSCILISVISIAACLLISLPGFRTLQEHLDRPWLHISLIVKLQSLRMTQIILLNTLCPINIATWGPFVLILMGK
ncbi:unnamed protein product [Victoria cruziana]